MATKCVSRITALLVLAFSLFACQGITAPLPRWPVATEIAVDDEYGGGIGSRFDSTPDQQRYDDPSDTAGSFTWGVYQVEPGDALQGELGLLNHFSNTMPVRLLLLMNYEQAEFQLDDRGFASSFETELLPDQVYTYTLTTGPLEEGYYDFAMVVVINPEITAMDTLSRVRTTFTPVIRRSVFVGNAMPPTIEFQPFQTVMDDPNGGSFPILTDKSRKFNLWPGPGRKVAPGVEFDIFLRFGTPDYTARRGGDLNKDDVPIALVAFMDDQVVPIGVDSVVYGKEYRGEVVTIPITVVAPKTPGIHQFFIHRFPNPYVRMRKDVLVDSLSSQRIVIEVQKP